MQASRVDNKTKKKPFGLHTYMHAYTRALVVGLQIAYTHGWSERALRLGQKLYSRGQGKARQGKPNRPSHASQPVRRNVAGSQGQTQGRILEGGGKVLGGSIIITVGLDLGMTGVFGKL
jgi:hypothetical protein